MNRLTDTNLVFRALIILGVVAFGFYLTAERGLLSLALGAWRLALGADRSYISYVILGLYILASAHWLWLSHALTEERKRFANLEIELTADERNFKHLQQGLIGQFLRNWQVRRPRFSWTRIKGESDVQGGRGNGSVEEGEGSWVGADGGSPEGERSRRRRCGGWGGGLGTRAAVEREPETGRGSAAAARRVAGHGLA